MSFITLGPDYRSRAIRPDVLGGGSQDELEMEAGGPDSLLGGCGSRPKRGVQTSALLASTVWERESEVRIGGEGVGKFRPMQSRSEAISRAPDRENRNGGHTESGEQPNHSVQARRHVRCAHDASRAAAQVLPDASVRENVGVKGSMQWRWYNETKLCEEGAGSPQSEPTRDAPLHRGSSRHSAYGFQPRPVRLKRADEDGCGDGSFLRGETPTDGRTLFHG